MIVQGEETIPEKDMQLLKEFLQTILNPAKLPDTPTGIWNHGPERLERLLERHADASKEESLIDADGARNSFIHFKHFINTGSNKDKTPTEICEILAKPGVYEDIFILCSHVLGNKKVHAYYVPSRNKQAQFYERLAWDKALQWGKRKQMGSNRKNSGERSEPSGYLGRGKGWWSLEKCLWCSRSMIPDSGIMLWLVSSCWQICVAVDSITLFQYHTPTIQEKIF